MNTNYIPKTDEEIKQLALDIVRNLVFTSDHIDPASAPNGLLDTVMMIFPVLMLMPPEQRANLVEWKISLFYEELNKASPTSINGYPIFFSCRMLSETDHKRLNEKLKALREAMAAA